MKTPVLYRLNEEGEADDVIWFCSPECRADYVAHGCDEGETAEGDNPDAITGTVCEMCGKEVPNGQD